MKCDIKFKIDDNNGHLLVSYDNGCVWEDLGKVTGGDGTNGVNGSNGTPGSDGVDGITPLLRVVNNKLEVSYDAGSSWSIISDDISGDNGTDGDNGTQIIVDSAIGTDTQTGVPYVQSTPEGSSTIRLKFFNLRGLKGDNGNDGTPGTLVNFNFKPSEVYCTEINDAYVDGNGHLQVLVAIDETTTPATKTYQDCGTFAGPQGETGPQGIEGPQGIQGERGNKIFFVHEYANPFSVEDAQVSDILIYIGDNIENTINNGDMFECTAIEASVQTWEYRLNVRGPKGDNSDIVTPSFRMVENPQSGSSQLQVSLNAGLTWTAIGNVPTKGISSVYEVQSGEELKHIYRIAYTDGTYYDMVIFDGSGDGGSGGGVTLALNIKADAASCTAVGDAYIDQDTSHTTYGHIMILTALPSTFTDGGEIKGDKGDDAHVYIKYSPVAAPTDQQIVDNPTVGYNYIGFCSTSDATAPTAATRYTWSKYAGEDGMGVQSLVYTGGGTAGQPGNNDPYTLMSDHSTSLGSIIVHNGSNGTNGANGADGSKWYNNTSMSGTSGTISGPTGDEQYKVGDYQLNTSSGNVYKCTTAGQGAASQWIYVGNIKGSIGQTGAEGNGITATINYVNDAAGGAGGAGGWNQMCYRPSLVPYMISETGGTIITRLKLDGQVKVGDTVVLYGTATDNNQRYICLAEVTVASTSGGITLKELGGFQLLQGADGQDGADGADGAGIAATIEVNDWDEQSWVGYTSLNDVTSQTFATTTYTINRLAADGKIKVNDLILVYGADTDNGQKWECYFKATSETTSGNVVGVSAGGLQLKQGAAGQNGTTPTIQAAAGANIGSVGTPSVTATTSGTTTTFTFNYLKGANGQDGADGSIVSKAYRFVSPNPYTSVLRFVNNIDSISIEVTIERADARITINQDDEYANVHLTFYLYCSGRLDWTACMDVISAYGGGSSVVGTVTGSLESSKETTYDLPTGDKREAFYGTLNIKHYRGWHEEVEESERVMVLDLHGVLAVNTDFQDMFADGTTFDLSIK